MPIIRPYRVTIRPTGDDKLLGGSWLCYATGTERAAIRTAAVRRKFRRVHDVRRHFKDGIIVVDRLHPWRATALRGPAGRFWTLHATSRDSARLQAADALSARTEDVYIEGCDDFLVLETLPDEELETQCQIVWGIATIAKEQLDRRVPTLRKRIMKRYGGKTHEKMAASTRLQCIYALALAQHVPQVGPQEGRRAKKEHYDKGRQKVLRDKAERRHAANVPEEVLQEMYDAGFDKDPEPFGANERSALARFTRAYGLNPEKVGIWGMYALWTEGPKVIR